jgi:hypothetical protein
MKKSAAIAISAIALAMAGLLVSPLAGATGHGGANWSVSVGTPPPVVYGSPPVIYEPPVYVQPQPVYVQPRPVYVTPVTPVAPAPIIVPSQGYYYYDGYRPYYYGHGRWRHHHWHDHR